MKMVRPYRKYMIRSTALLLVALTIAHPFHKDLITLGFHLNRSYIAQNFCENTDKPELMCAGICQLKKKLVEAEESQQQETIQYLTVDIQCSEVETDLLSPNQYVELSQTLWPEIGQVFVEPDLQAIFKPPIAV